MTEDNQSPKPPSLEQRLQIVREQKEQHRNLYHQAIGAEQVLLTLIEEQTETKPNS